MKVTAQTRRIELPPEFQRRDPSRIAKLVALWAAWLVSILAIDRLLATGAAPLQAGAIALGALTGFLVVAGIGFLGHDIAHGSVVAGERAMRFWTFWSLTAVLFVPYFLWVRWHNAFHHRYSNTPRDSDRLLREDEIGSGLASYTAYRLMNLFGFSLQYVAARLWRIVHGRKGWSDRKKRADVIAMALVLALYAAAVALLPARTFLAGVLLPVLVSLVTVSFYIQSNHFSRPITDKPEPVKGSADVSVPAVMDLFHSNFSRHTAHHLFPTVASRHYPWITTRIATVFREDYRCVPFFASVRDNLTLPKIVRDGKYLVDRHGRVRRELS